MTAEDKQLLLVRIGFEGRSETIKRIPRSQLKPGYINRLFNCDVEFLKVELPSGTATFRARTVERRGTPLWIAMLLVDEPQ